MPEITIIVPVYNVKPYLKKCLDSILNQSFEDFYLYLVDDGASDGSEKICDEYEKTDDRIKVFHKENKGQGSARNFGIDRVKTPYIGFIDSDDYIHKDMYKILYEDIKREDADMAMCALFDIYSGKPEKVNKDIQNFVMDKKEATKTVLEAKLTSVTPVNKLYKTSLFENIRYPEGKDMGEDAAIIIDLILNCKKITLTTKQLYYYIHHENSSTTRDFLPKDVSVIEAYEKNFNLVTKNFPDLENVARMRICWANFFVLDKLLMSQNRKNFKEVEKKCCNFLRKHFFFILKDESFLITRKISTFFLLIHPNLYKILVRIQRSKQGL